MPGYRGRPIWFLAEGGIEVLPADFHDLWIDLDAVKLNPVSPYRRN